MSTIRKLQKLDFRVDSKPIESRAAISNDSVEGQELRQQFRFHAFAGLVHGHNWLLRAINQKNFHGRSQQDTTHL
jgi:hypothetical protein